MGMGPNSVSKGRPERRSRASDLLDRGFAPWREGRADGENSWQVLKMLCAAPGSAVFSASVDPDAKEHPSRFDHPMEE
jgi:hypothetical protein